MGRMSRMQLFAWVLPGPTPSFFFIYYALLAQILGSKPIHDGAIYRWAWPKLAVRPRQAQCLMLVISLLRVLYRYNWQPNTFWPCGSGYNQSMTLYNYQISLLSSTHQYYGYVSPNKWFQCGIYIPSKRWGMWSYYPLIWNVSAIACCCDVNSKLFVNSVQM